MSETRRAHHPLASLALVSASSSTAQAGRLNRFNAGAADLVANLPELESLGFGARLQLQKFDSSTHTVTITVAAGDLISNQATSVVLSRHMELVELAVINDTWEIIGQYLPAPNGALVNTEGVATLKNKTISGADNTITNIPMSALGTGKVQGATHAGAAKSYTMVALTASQYAALSVKDPDTLYIVVP